MAGTTKALGSEKAVAVVKPAQGGLLEAIHLKE